MEHVQTAARLLHPGDYYGTWYSAHDRQGRVIATRATLDALRTAAPDAHAYRERTDRGEGDVWAPARTLDLFPDHAGGTLF